MLTNMAEPDRPQMTMQ